MGDRTTVQVTIRKSDYNNIVKELGGKDKFENEVYVEETEIDNNIVTLTASEINYAEWDDLEGLLKDRKIEYDKNWAAGSEYEAGDAYIRLIDGELRELEIGDTNYERETVYNEILEVAKKGDIKKVVELIEKRLKEIRPYEIPPLDQPNSVRFIQED